MCDEVVPYGCNDVWYEFEKTSEETVWGEPIKASPDFNTENVMSGVIEANMECTVTAYINATLDIQLKSLLGPLFLLLGQVVQHTEIKLAIL